MRRVQLDSLEQQDYRAYRELLVLRVQWGSEVNLDPEAAQVFQGHREDQDCLEIREHLDAVVGTDKRDNQENQVNEGLQERWAP